ncbi:hypothetical protein HYC85_003444 [Camellia sinensis]|uniref:Uncharacterized protein n=1 Tax=Camellia sinensis TaxID=4442 RepID=A0A7J7HUC2_CAMSI|nr:hypothetical protein HYC85_003444 [Camellia sinensis]
MTLLCDSTRHQSLIATFHTIRQTINVNGISDKPYPVNQTQSKKAPRDNTLVPNNCT